MLKIKWLLLIFVVGVTLISCNKIDSFNITNEYDVSLTTAKSVANNVLLVKTENNKSNKLLKDLLVKKDVESITNVPDENNETAYYVINYKGGGFIILAGDKRSEPILAFSETNKFDINSEGFPSGLVSWLYLQKEKIKDIRNNKVEIDSKIKEVWDNLIDGGENVILDNLIPPPDDDDSTPDTTPDDDDDIIPDDDGSTSYIIQKGPFLQTTWGQDCGYNSETPSMTCDVPCGHAWTGCVVTAMAQVMKYYQYPANYNWTDMPNSYGTTTTATLMRDIWNAVNMDYNCDGSGADTKNEVASSFINDFGYSTATYADYNYQTVKNELNYGRPVILRGGSNTGWWIFGQYSDGHAWVCDGYLNYIYPGYFSYLMFHMNWGWNDSYNGWYNFNNFNPSDYTFNYQTGMVYNIKP